MSYRVRRTETQTGGQLNLTPRADCAEYSAYVVGEIAGSIAEDGISVASQCKWTLCVTRDFEIRMIEQIVGLRSNRNLYAFPQTEALLQRQIELRKRGAAQDIAPSIAKLAGEGAMQMPLGLNQQDGVLPTLLPFGPAPCKDCQLDLAVPKSIRIANLHCRTKARG